MVLYLFMGFQAIGQQSNLICKWVKPESGLFSLDSLPVEPGSVYFKDTTIRFEVKNNLIELKNSSTNKDSIEICYRTLSGEFFEQLYLRDITNYDPQTLPSAAILAATTTEIDRNSVFDTPGLFKTGTISRGISLGNQQSLFVNSTLNLQLQGKLTDDLNIRAVITDQNIPFQPEGNTQQIRDFDRVLIEVYNEQFNLMAGDIVLDNRTGDGHFLKYFKNQQGFQASYRFDNEKFTSTSKASIAGAKGKFASISLEPLEGVQGPYRLRGADNERFIIVLANSERIFIDGKQLERGFDRDYIIDYNLGEITFNPSVVITRFTRIRADFEYTQQSYLRSIQYYSQMLEGEKWNFSLDFYREKDNERQPLSFDLQRTDISRLESIGDNISDAFISGIDSVGFIASQIRYARRDTLIAGQTLVYYVFSSIPEEAVFSLIFTPVGANQGNYVQLPGSQNGTVYEWVPPVNGIPQGSFEPIINQVLPNLRQMLVGRFSVNPTEKMKVYQEVALSNHDLNLYSEIDNQDNQGIGSLTGIELNDVPAFGRYKWSTAATLEYNHENFRPIDRFRQIEFDRDWNYLNPYDSVPQQELIGTFTSSIKKDARNFARYRMDARKRGDVLQGTQQSLSINQYLGKFYYKGEHFLLGSEQAMATANWRRSYSEVGVDLPKGKMALFYEIDENEVSNENGDIRFSAMHFRQQGLLLQQGDSSRFTYTTRVSYREDQLPVLGEMELFTKAWQFQQSFASPQNLPHNIAATATYRKVNELIASEQDDQTLQGQLILNNRFGKNLINSKLNYILQNARELERAFVFTLVGAGQGTHTWRDENGDGIQDLNEFYEAINPDERNYAKFFVPTDNYINAYQMRYIHTIDAMFPSSWRNLGSFRGFLSKVSSNINFNIQQKTTSGEWLERINPFGFLESAQVLSQQSNRRYSLFFNRSAGKIGLSTSYTARDNRSVNQSGFELSQLNQWENSLRYTISKNYLVNFNMQTGRRFQESDFLTSRNFLLNQQALKSEFSWQPTQTIRLSALHLYQIRKNVLSELTNEYSRMHDAGLQAYWSSATTGTATAAFHVIHFDFGGDPATYLGYILLDGLQPGVNSRLNLNWQQNLKNGLQLTLQYFGRKSEETSVIHSGNVQLTAFF